MHHDPQSTLGLCRPSPRSSCTSSSSPCAPIHSGLPHALYAPRTFRTRNTTHTHLLTHTYTSTHLHPHTYTPIHTYIHRLRSEAVVMWSRLHHACLQHAHTDLAYRCAVLLVRVSLLLRTRGFFVLLFVVFVFLEYLGTVPRIFFGLCFSHVVFASVSLS